MGFLRWLKSKVEPAVATTAFRDEPPPPAVLQNEREEAHRQIRATYGAEVLGIVMADLKARTGMAVRPSKVDEAAKDADPTEDEWGAAMESWGKRL